MEHCGSYDKNFSFVSLNFQFPGAVDLLLFTDFPKSNRIQYWPLLVGKIAIKSSIIQAKASNIPQYGIHGTVEPELIGKSVSGGCVRMRNADVEELYMLIPEGTKVLVEDGY